MKGLQFCRKFLIQSSCRLFTFLLVILVCMNFLNSFRQLNSDDQINRNKIDELQKFIEKYKLKMAEVIRENIELKQQLKLSDMKIIEPSFMYEKHRRRVFANIHSFWEYFKNRFLTLKEERPNVAKNLTDMYDLIYEYKLFWLSDLEIMSRNDGYDTWRRQLSKSLSKIVQKRYSKLQNPKSCKDSNILKCKVSNHCGWGCQIHHITDCFNMAHALDRTVDFNATNFLYNPAGFDGILEPFSDICKPFNEVGVEWIEGIQQQEQIIYINESTVNNPKYPSKFTPNDLFPYLEKLTDNPISWWYGQLVKFTIKYPDEMVDEFKKSSQSVFNGDPIVGVHIRRTDKILFESKLITLETYLSYVDEYFDQLELTQKINKRRIYLASEEPKVYEEMKIKYPHYEVYSNEKAANEAFSTWTRYSKSSLKGVVTDIEMLSNCDYVVCTFSSNICRLILEVFQTKHVDASNRVKNLDAHYATLYLSGPHGVAIRDHNPTGKNEVELKVGDQMYIYVAYNQNGQYSIYNHRALKNGLVPNFKIEILYESYQAARNFSLV